MIACAGAARVGEEQAMAGIVDVDARGLLCPEPVLAARAALAPLAPGMRIRVLATDPLSPVDLAAWCARAGHRIVEEQVANLPYEIVIERG
jgi:tRNA 2-thiouridine synthesizing protein A